MLVSLTPISCDLVARHDARDEPPAPPPVKPGRIAGLPVIVADEREPFVPVADGPALAPGDPDGGTLLVGPAPDTFLAVWWLHPVATSASTAAVAASLRSSMAASFS
jgi:hypothetical protein